MAGDKIICHCKQVSYIDIRKAMIAGARTVQEIKDMTGAATGCGRCVGEIEKILASVCGCTGVSLEDVVNAVKNGKFHIYAVSTIDEGIEILTGVPAGKKDKNGKFPLGTINYLAYEKLKKFYKIADKQNKN